jgi:hypothetical protein
MKVLSFIIGKVFWYGTVVVTVTFKDLQKLVQSQSGPGRSLLSQRNKPFWIWKRKQHRQEVIRTKGDCCFNHIIGLPKKDRIEKSLIMRSYFTDSSHTRVFQPFKT